MIRRVLALSLGVLLASVSLPAVAAPADDPSQGTVWDLSPLYSEAGAWERERAALEAELPNLAALASGFGSSPASLRTGLDRISDAHRRLERLQAYADLSVSADARDTAAQAREQSFSALQAKYDAATAFVEPAVIALGRERIEAFEKAEPGLARHRRTLELILRRSAHTLSPDAEKVLAASGPLRAQVEVVHSTFANAEFPWPTLAIDGKPVRLTPGAYGAIMGGGDRSRRKQAYETYTATLNAYRNTQAAILAAYLDGSAFEAKARGYPSSLALALADDNMPESAYTTMVAETDKALPALYRYLTLRKKLVGLDEAYTYDLYAPLAPDTRVYRLDEAEDLILKALAPLGPDYVATLHAGFRAKLMDAQPRPGKAGIGETNGAYGVPLFVMTTFTGDEGSVSVVAHEWGHEMHSRFADANQPYETASYSFFVADAPSLTNELLLADYLIAHAKTRDERITAIENELELIRGSYYGPAFYEGFELKLHEMADRGEPIDGDGVSKLYCSYLRRFDGADQGVTKVEDKACAGWSTMYNLYYNFYTYRYLTAVSASAYFAEGIEHGDTALRDRFFTLLKSGGSDDPYVLLKHAGFDAASPDAYAPMRRRFEHLVDELAAETAKPAK